MSGNFHPSLFWQFSDVSFHPLHMLVLSLIDNWVLVISVHTVSFLDMWEKVSFAIFILFAYVPTCCPTFCGYTLVYLGRIFAQEIRRFFYSIQKFSYHFIKWQCSLIVNLWTFECTWDIFAPWSQNLLLMNFELPMLL